MDERTHEYVAAFRAVDAGKERLADAMDGAFAQVEELLAAAGYTVIRQDRAHFGTDRRYLDLTLVPTAVYVPQA